MTIKKTGLCPVFLCFWFEILFADAAHGAAPAVGEFLKRGAGGYAVVGIALCGIVNVTANFAYILFHSVVFWG